MHWSARSCRLGGGVAIGAASLLFATGVYAQGGSNHASPGDNNKGDVWTDNVGQPAGPGHEQDPHLACANINIWGNGLGDSGGSYTVDGWPPSGSQEIDYSSSWAYNTAAGGTQVISVINVQQLVATARAHGDAEQNSQGLHFKLDLSQDPQKHKTFWVDCAAPAPSPTPTPRPTPSPEGTPTPSPEGTPTPSPSPSAGDSPSATPSPSQSASPSPSSSPSGGVGGATNPPIAGGVQGLSTGSVDSPATGAGIAAGLAGLLLGVGGALLMGSDSIRRRRMR
jgi:hypothetical protein